MAFRAGASQPGWKSCLTKHMTLSIAISSAFPAYRITSPTRWKQRGRPAIPERFLAAKPGFHACRPRVRPNARAANAPPSTPIQGTSADIIKRAMVRMGPALGAAGLGQVKMLLQVHEMGTAQV